MGIRIEGLKVVFRARDGTALPVLSVPHFELADGEHRCIVGPSGKGKTTLLNVLAGIVRPAEGRVEIDGTDLFALSEASRDRFRARHIGYVFQTFNLLQGLSALENVAIALGFAGVSGREAKARAEEILVGMGLHHRLGARPGTLSVGEQQRVAIARAVANGPRVVLADEPTANLDEENGDQVIELLKQVTSEAGSMLVLVTHEPRIQARFTAVVPLAELVA